MRRHPGRTTFIFDKGIKVFRQFAQRMRQNRQPQMRIGFGTAVSGHMFNAGTNAVIEISVNQSTPQQSGFLFVVAEATGFQHRMSAWICHIKHRGKIKIDSAALQIAADDPRVNGGHLFIQLSQHILRSRRMKIGTAQPPYPTALLIYGNQNIVATDGISDFIRQLPQLSRIGNIAGKQRNAGRIIFFQPAFFPFG